MKSTALRKKINEYQGQKNYLKSKLTGLKTDLFAQQKEIEIIEKARIIIQKVALLTQKEIEIKLSHIVTLAIEAIFQEKRYEFKIEFIEKRGKTEVEFWLIEKESGERITPFDVGGGIVDIVTFALRVAIWSLSGARNVLIFDEPFRFLSQDLHENAAKFIEKVSQELGLQIIMVTHSPYLVIGKVFEVNKIGKYSKVKEV
jgi:DNA repair exonuclease SbcCD ATPase subunit